MNPLAIIKRQDTISWRFSRLSGKGIRLSATSKQWSRSSVIASTKVCRRPQGVWQSPRLVAPLILPVTTQVQACTCSGVDGAPQRRATLITHSYTQKPCGHSHSLALALADTAAPALVVVPGVAVGHVRRCGQMRRVGGVDVTSKDRLRHCERRLLGEVLVGTRGDGYPFGARTYTTQLPQWA